MKGCFDKIALSSNDNKRLQSNDPIETYAYGMSKNLASEKEDIQCNYIIKWCKNDYLWWCYIRKIKAIQIGHKFPSVKQNINN